MIVDECDGVGVGVGADVDERVLAQVLANGEAGTWQGEVTSRFRWHPDAMAALGRLLRAGLVERRRVRVGSRRKGAPQPMAVTIYYPTSGGRG